MRGSRSLVTCVTTIALLCTSVGSASAASLPSQNVVREFSSSTTKSDARRGYQGNLFAVVARVGSGEILQGRAKSLTIRVTNGTRKDLTGLGIRLRLPNGFTLLSSTKSVGQWACSSRSHREVTCLSSKSLNRGAKTSVMVKVGASHDVTVGYKKISVSPFAKGSVVGPIEVHTLRVLDRGDPKMKPVITFVKIPHSSKSMISASATKRPTQLRLAHVGVPFVYSAAITNKGFDRLAAGKVVAASQSFGADVRVVSVTTANKTKCMVASRKWVCRLTTTKPVNPNGVLDTIRVTLLPTAEALRLSINPLRVRTPGQTEIETASVKVRAETAPDQVTIHTKDLYKAHEGGTSSVRVVLKNVGDVAIAKGHVISVDLPRGIVFLSGNGKNWRCLQGVQQHTASCTYLNRLGVSLQSTPLIVRSRVRSGVVASIDGYDMRFSSSKGATTHKLTIEHAPKVNASFGLIKRSDGSYAIGLTGEVNSVSNRHYESLWVQRCTTVEDARSRSCPSHRVTPAITLTGASDQDAEALVPVSKIGRTYVFEYRAVTDSVSATTLVQVKVPSGTARSLSVSAATSAPTIASDVLAALARYGITPTGTPTASASLITQNATISGNIGSQLAVLGSAATITYNAATDTSTTCAKATLDTSRASLFGQEMNVSNFTIVASRSSSCTWNGTAVNGGMMSFSLNVFGTNVTFSQVLDPSTFPGTLSLTTNLATLDYPFLNDNLTFKNVALTLGIDTSLGTGSLTLGVNVDILGTTVQVGGMITFNKALKQVTGDLMMSQTRSISVAGVTFSNFMFGIGISYASGSPDVALNVIGSGSIGFLGDSVAFKEISVSVVGDVIVSASIEFSTTVNDPGVFSLDGDFVFQWQAPTASKPNANVRIDAKVELSAGGFSLGTPQNPAVFSWSSKCVSIDGEVIIPNVLTADVSGAMLTSNGICSSIGTGLPVTGFFANLPMPGLAGDYRFDAENVKFNVSGLQASGDFSFGRIAGAPFGKVDVTTTLTSRAVNAKVSILGDIDPILGTTLEGSAVLDIGGYKLNATVNQVLTPTKQSITVSGSLKVSGISVAVTGQEGTTKVNGVPVPTMSLTGNASFKLDGYDLGNAAFTLKESPTDSGLSATSSINLGPLKADATFGFKVLGNGDIAYQISADGSIKWDRYAADVEVASTNCDVWEVCYELDAARVSLNGGITLSGQYFGMGWFPLNPDGSFKVTSSDAGSYTVEGEDSKVEFLYTYTAIVSSEAPYVDLSSDFTAKGYLRYDRHWYKEVETSDGITFRLDPFYVSVRLCIKDIGCATWHS